VTSNEVKARLSLVDAPALDLAWWRATRGNQEIWRTLVALLRYRTAEGKDGKVDIVGVEFDDRDIRQKEGFDYYGRLAMGYALIPLIKVNDHHHPLAQLVHL
jgi:hypothetical protein